MSNHLDTPAPKPAAELIDLQLALCICFALDSLLQQKKYLMTDTVMKYEQQTTFEPSKGFGKPCIS